MHIDLLRVVQQLRGQVCGWEERGPDQPIPASDQGRIYMTVMHLPMAAANAEELLLYHNSSVKVKVMYIK